MGTYIALLRGVNVAQTRVTMDRLREIWSDLGYTDVRTYVQSGNVLFESRDPVSHCVAAIEKRLARELGVSISVTMRTPAKLREILSGNPFLSQKGIDPAKLHVTFLAARPSASSARALATIASPPDAHHLRGMEVYLHCPDGYGRTKLSNTALEKILGVRATTRNWKTVNALHEMATNG